MWYTKFGPSGDIVLSSRIRLARNIKKLPFGAKMTAGDLKTIEEKCKSALPEFNHISLSKLTIPEKESLKECHLISPEMAEKSSGSILINETCTISILIGEEDHLRLQVMDSGLKLEECMKIADEIDSKLEKNMDFAYSAQLGYLTCCPTNVGTGLRASCMLHLPALTESKGMDSIIRSLSKIGITVRGIYGEGSPSLANLYQVSNQVTLGISEKDSITKLGQIISELIEKERLCGHELYKNNKFKLEDKIERAFGILQNSRLMTSNEATQLLSHVRWGINLGIIKDINHEQLLDAFYSILPGSIAKSYNLTSSAERDLKRSEILKDKLKNSI